MDSAVLDGGSAELIVRVEVEDIAGIVVVIDWRVGVVEKRGHFDVDSEPRAGDWRLRDWLDAQSVKRDQCRVSYGIVYGWLALKC